MKNLLTGALLMTLSSISIASNEQEIIQVIHNYAQGTETNNVSLIDQSFHPDFRVVALTEQGVRVIDKKSYLSLLGAKKIGGQQRTLLIKQLNIQSQTAQANVKLSGGKSVFNDKLQLLKQKGVWQIVNNLTEVQTYSTGDEN